MKKIISFVCSITALLSTHAQSSPTRYVAKPKQSSWKMEVSTPLECTLVHDIPYYGKASFRSRASKKINIDFELKMNRPMGDTRNVSLISMPPAWKPGQSAEPITDMRFFKQFNGYINGQVAWGILSELEKGRYPTFRYSDWHSRNKSIEVALSSVMFQQAYNEFSACVHSMLAYSFEDISFTILHYDRNSDQLNKASQKRLAQIAEYIKYNKDIDLVLVNTYTDSSGGKNMNQSLSEKRATALGEYFKSIGLPGERVQVHGYGERRPVSDNSTPIGKDQNRRVVITLGRTEI